ncbi:MAG TPA: four helix bundle protein [Gemmatimonadales bacterium]|nr:four helix bundle protein [Gemmatimonadales bacterium]
MPVHDHRGLVVWQRGMDLVAESCRLASRLPAFERYGLASQLRRSAVSVPANIAEGNGRAHRGDYLRHLSIARGSLHELSTLIDIAERLGYASAAELAVARDLLRQTVRMLTALQRSLRT